MTDPEGEFMRARMWSRVSGRAIVTVSVIVLCAGIGMAATYAARSNASHAIGSRAGRLGERARTRADAATVRARQLTAERAALAQSLAFTPATGASDVALDATVAVTSATGRLTAVRVTGADGVSVDGSFASADHAWLSQGVLAPGSTYTVTATAVGPRGATATKSSSFHTLTPAGRINATVFPGQTLTLGVAQPIAIRFDQPVTSSAARAAVLSHLTVTESQPVPGGWHWFSAHELHFRPEQFWPAGEQITFEADFDGWDAGNGLWGQGQTTVHFAIGDAHVSIANLATDQMTVIDNGRVVAVYPFSGGRDKYPTMNGIHIVLDRESVVHMVSSTNGIPVNSPDGYDELVYSDVHITDTGEYVHAAPWSVGNQGRSNVSHGCINLSPADAAAFFSFSRVGDVVEVVGGPRPPLAGDHGVMDWETKWSDWTPAVVHAVPTPSAITAPNPNRTPR